MARKNWVRTAKNVGYSLRDMGKVVVAGATGAALLAANVAKGVWGKASATASGLPFVNKPQKTEEGVLKMKKSTLVALVVALAAIAGGLAALYFFLLRRERELEEYEQLLFSEDTESDFGDIEDYNLPDEDSPELA